MESFLWDLASILFNFLGFCPAIPDTGQIDNQSLADNVKNVKKNLTC